MNDTGNSILDKMIELRATVETRLAANEDYRMLLALNRAIAEITGDAPPANMLEGNKPKPKERRESVALSGMSQADASYVLLSDVFREPITIATLVKALGAHGINVGGANPNVNLSSVLSKDGRFRSVRFKDRSSWWVIGTPFPGELDND